MSELGIELFRVRSKNKTSICVNVDFFSGFVYKMLNIPQDLFTPLFAVGRIPGWCAHRLEELTVSSRIIRPAYKSIHPIEEYVPISKRG